MIVGLLPLAAGMFDLCVLGPIFGVPLRGEDVRRLPNAYKHDHARCWRAYVWIAQAKNDPSKQGRELHVPRLPATGPNAELCAVAPSNAGSRSSAPAGPSSGTHDLRGRLTGNRLDPGKVARILRRRAVAAGVSGDFAEHSLRRGFITNAAKKKIPIENIKRVTGQMSRGVVLDYVAAATHRR